MRIRLSCIRARARGKGGDKKELPKIQSSSFKNGSKGAVATTGANKLISSDDMTAEGSCTMNSDVHRNVSVI